MQNISVCNIKGLEGVVGKSNRVKQLSNGSVWVECATENHSRNIRLKILCNIPIHILPHVSLNTSKSVIKSSFWRECLRRFVKTGNSCKASVFCRGQTCCGDSDTIYVR